MATYIIKAKDGSGWVQGLAQNKNNANKRIVVITTTASEAQKFSHRKAAKSLLRKWRFATSNYEIEFVEENNKTLQYVVEEDY